MPARILVAEDDPMQARLIRVYLEREGYRVMTVSDGRAALDAVRARNPDLLVLDIMMPGVNGLDICRILRADSRIPILLLTARTTEEDKLLGLDLGADDYVTKPYSPRELAARTRALLRRAGTIEQGHGAVHRVGELVVDQDKFEVRLGERRIATTAKEFALLEVLAAEPGRVFTRAQLLERVYGFDTDVLARTVDAHVANLRRKLEPDPGRPCYVATVVGRGYKLATDEDRASGTG